MFSSDNKIVPINKQSMLNFAMHIRSYDKFNGWFGTWEKTAWIGKLSVKFCNGSISGKKENFLMSFTLTVFFSIFHHLLVFVFVAFFSSAVAGYWLLLFALTTYNSINDAKKSLKLFTCVTLQRINQHTTKKYEVFHIFPVYERLFILRRYSDQIKSFTFTDGLFNIYQRKEKKFDDNNFWRSIYATILLYMYTVCIAQNALNISIIITDKK